MLVIGLGKWNLQFHQVLFVLSELLENTYYLKDVDKSSALHNSVAIKSLRCRRASKARDKYYKVCANNESSLTQLYSASPSLCARGEDHCCCVAFGADAGGASGVVH